MTLSVFALTSIKKVTNACKRFKLIHPHYILYYMFFFFPVF